MNRRHLIGWAVAAATGAEWFAWTGGNEQAIAHTATPVVEFDGPDCDLALEYADLRVQMQIPVEVTDSALDGIVASLSARIHALGWASCSVDRYDRLLLVNVQILADRVYPDGDLVSSLLSEAGRVDVVDGGEGHLEVGDRIATSSMPATKDGPDINVVYQAVLTNLDFASFEPFENEVGQLVARVKLTEAAGRRLEAFTAANPGSQMPLVLDGQIVLTPVVQGELGREFDLLPVDSQLLEQLRVFTSAPPYPEPLVVTVFDDRRGQ